MQYGGGNCSLCGSPGTNKTTCPLNKSALNKSHVKHPLAREMIKKLPHDDKIIKLVKVASSWAGHGRYITDNETIIAHNYPGSPPYQFDDFKLFFLSNWTTDDPRLDETLKTYARRQYTNKTMSMNCWEFLLLCLHEAGYVTASHIVTLYNHALKRKGSRIPEFFNLDLSKKNPDQLVKGHIILYYKKSKIWHVGIAISETEYIHCMGIGVSLSTYHPKYNTDEDGIYLVEPSLMCVDIVNLPVIETTMSITDKQELEHAIMDEPGLNK